MTGWRAATRHRRGEGARAPLRGVPPGSSPRTNPDISDTPVVTVRDMAANGWW